MNVFITGAAGGLGRALAAECARRGYHLFLTDINGEGLRRIQTGLKRRYGVPVLAKACDLTDASSVDDTMTMIDSEGIRFDMLCNVAGIDFEGGFMNRSRETIVKIVSLNNAATLRITHAVLERRREGAHFTVLFVSSLASMFPMPLKATYAASKRFLYDFSLALRQELKTQDVGVTVLCPRRAGNNKRSHVRYCRAGFLGQRDHQQTGKGRPQGNSQGTARQGGLHSRISQQYAGASG